MLVMQYEGECENFIQSKNCWSYLSVTDYFWLNQQKINESDEIRRWVRRKYGMSIIIQKFHSIEKQLLLPYCCQKKLIEPTKQWMRVIEY